MLDNLPEKITVVEVGPRDGLQNEEKLVPTAQKVRLIESLANAGLKRIEVTSFVSPKWIPQLADGLEVIKALKLNDDVITSALVPNMKGYEAFSKSGVKQVALFMSATESHSKKNINKSIAEALGVLGEVAKNAQKDRLSVRCYLSVVFACPYEGTVQAESVVTIVKRLLDLGVDQISLGDTIGAATPNQVISLMSLLLKEADSEKFALHFHDTRGTALANVLAGLTTGVTTFDASIGGMGGCPYAPGAAGNLATEDLVYMLNGMDIKTGIDLSKLVDSGVVAQEIVARDLPGRYLKAALAHRAQHQSRHQEREKSVI